MVSPIFTSGMAGARQAMRRHQRVPPRPPIPLWKLVLGEIAYLLRQLRQPRRTIPAVVAATAIVIGLSPWTPGPVAAPALLILLAGVAAALGVWGGPRLVAHRGVRNGETVWRAGPARPGTNAGGWRRAISGVATVLVAALTVVAAGWLLAILIAAVY